MNAASPARLRTPKRSSNGRDCRMPSGEDACAAITDERAPCRNPVADRLTCFSERQVSQRQEEHNLN